MNFTPLLVRLDTKADKSPRTPPPKAITQSDLLKFSFIKNSINLYATLKFFNFSFTCNLQTLRLYFFSFFFSFFSITCGTFLSAIRHIFFILGNFFLIN